MKRIIAALVLTASLALAPQALAHPNVTGSASQACDGGGKVKLVATFSNAGFDEETTVTATDSQAGDLGTQGSPASFEATYFVTERAAGTVTFDWTTPGDSGSVVAPYDAVSGCVTPPPPPPPPTTTTTTTTTTTPPPPPPNNGPPPSGGPPAPPAVQGGELPMTGASTWLLAIVGFGLVTGGMALWLGRKESQ